MKKTRPTLSIGIPAYNEEGNIENLLKSLLSQKRELFKLEKIYVVSDMSTDKTDKIVIRISKKNKIVELIVKDGRSGKATSLNLIYRLNKSDFVMAMDADLLFEKDCDIDLMMKEILKDKNLNYVGPRHVPVPSDSIMGKFAVVSYLSFEDAVLKLNDGNNFFSSMGVYLLTKKFSKTIQYPRNTQADQTILYGLATKKNKNAFKLVKNARVYFRGVSTFSDWRLLGTRSVIGDIRNTAEILGEEIYEIYRMPRKLFVFSLLKWFIRDPFNTLGSVIMNIYIRKFPLKEKMPINGVWETTPSAKIGIEL